MKLIILQHNLSFGFATKKHAKELTNRAWNNIILIHNRLYQVPLNLCKKGFVYYLILERYTICKIHINLAIHIADQGACNNTNHRKTNNLSEFRNYTFSIGVRIQLLRQITNYEPYQLMEEVPLWSSKPFSPKPVSLDWESFVTEKKTSFASTCTVHMKQYEKPCKKFNSLINTNVAKHCFVR